MTFRYNAVATVAGLAVLVSMAAGAQEAIQPSQAVDALEAVFGAQPGTRRGHAKGVCVAGNFTPAPEAASLSKAPHFAKPVPVTGRFSLGGGDPKAPDNAQDNVKGLALRFDLGGGAVTDLVMISAPIFFVPTPALFVELLDTVKTGDKEKIGAFFKAHPEATRQKAWLMSHPIPASYAGVDYFGVHAFTFTNADGKARLVKYKAVPDAGELVLTAEEATAKGPDFLLQEMQERLAKGPVSFELEAILGKEGDQTTDPTLRWEDEDNRPVAKLGRITIDKVVPDETCDAFTFLPANMVDGIAGPSDDPIFAVRSPAYVVSFTRRLAQPPQ